jgi:hypothetical protein
MKFSGHDKRVTLNLALHSVAARGVLGLIEALQLAKEADWELDRLPQAAVEVIYSTFDDAFEKVVLSEFEADPNYLIDLGPLCPGVCPLCGHRDIRWVFRVMNTQGGESCECGSECIVTWGICVKGAETAEAAKAVLAAQIRKAIRKLLIAEWHTETGFDPEWFKVIQDSLDRIRASTEVPYRLRSSAYYKRRDTRMLERFYNRTGWLNTETRWNDLARIVNFCRANDGKMTLRYLERYVTKAAKVVATKAAIEAGTIKTEVLPSPKSEDVTSVVTMEDEFKEDEAARAEDAGSADRVFEESESKDAEDEAREAELAWVRDQVAGGKGEPVVFTVPVPEAGITLNDAPPAYAPRARQLPLDFSAVCRELVFGKWGQFHQLSPHLR